MDYKKILVRATNWLGDAVMSLPALRALRERASIFLFFALFGVFSGRLSASDTNSTLGAWLNAQANIQTWSAEVVQTRALRSLTQPLTATGHIWFAAPNPQSPPSGTWNNVTLSHNWTYAGNGGGVEDDGNLDMHQVTIAFNSGGILTLA